MSDQSKTKASNLNARGTVFRDLSNQACELYTTGQTEESERLCRLLLTYADLGDLHKAKAHFILGLGSDNYVWHAQQAVDLLENLYTVRPGGSYTGLKAPSEEAAKVRDNLLQQARDNLKQAEKDEKTVRTNYERQFQAFRDFHQREPTDEELVTAHFEKNRQKADEFLAAYDDQIEEWLEDKEVQEEDDEDDEDDDLPFEAPASPPDSQIKDPEGGLGYFGDDDETPLPSSQMEEID